MTWAVVLLDEVQALRGDGARSCGVVEIFDHMPEDLSEACARQAADGCDPCLAVRIRDGAQLQPGDDAWTDRVEVWK